jgi:sulfur-carrier protein
MFIQVKLFVSLANYSPGTHSGIPFMVEVPDGSTISDLIKRLNLPEKEVNLSFVNGRHQSLEHPLKSEDQVGLFPLIGGG